MQDLLSQDEIDALLHGVDDGDIDTYEETDDTGVKSYDLASQDRIVRGRMPTLEMINERFARYTRISLFNLMRRNADVSTGGVQIMKFGEYIHTLYVPTSLNLVKVRPLRGAGLFVLDMRRQGSGTPLMRQIGRHVREGAMAYLRQQYRVMLRVFTALALLFAVLAYGFDLQNKWLPFTFICGGLFSALAGYCGMQTATLASTRTAAAARTSLGQSLKVAFRSGAVIGLVVVGLGLGNCIAWLLLVNWLTPASADGYRLVLVTTTVLTFSMGASLQALFARVGGGIYTKAADVGADLVGKVEAGIPEDDPRNPAVIADNVGDNVGDVAGMGADLFESYCGSLLAACALGAAAYVGDDLLQARAVAAPFVIAGLGILVSVAGVFLVRTGEKADQGALLAALSRGINTSAALGVLCSLA